MSYERLHGEEQFCSKNYFLEMTPSHAKMCLKSASEKLNFVGKSYMKILYIKL